MKKTYLAPVLEVVEDSIDCSLMAGSIGDPSYELGDGTGKDDRNQGVGTGTGDALSKGGFGCHFPTWDDEGFDEDEF